MPLGSAASFAITGFWFSDEEADFKQSFKALMVAQAILTGVVWILFNLIMKEKPELPPS